MHTVYVIGGGFLLLGGMLLLSIATKAERSAAIATACNYFIPVWAVIAAINMGVGVLHAGYTIRAEAPIFLGVFGLPAVVAYLLARRRAPGPGSS